MVSKSKTFLISLISNMMLKAQINELNESNMIL